MYTGLSGGVYYAILWWWWLVSRRVDWTVYRIIGLSRLPCHCTRPRFPLRQAHHSTLLQPVWMDIGRHLVFPQRILPLATGLGTRSRRRCSAAMLAGCGGRAGLRHGLHNRDCRRCAKVPGGSHSYLSRRNGSHLVNLSGARNACAHHIIWRSAIIIYIARSVLPNPFLLWSTVPTTVR